jgi:hypothetical protein
MITVFTCGPGIVFNFTPMPDDLKEWILRLGLSPLAVVGAMMLIYVLLGTIWESCRWCC